MQSLEVKIKEKETFYPIHIEYDSIENLKNKILSNLSGKKYLVVISEKVNKLYGKTLGFDNTKKFVLKDGEKEKNFSNYKKIFDKAIQIGLSRKDAIIAIGGGVVGDIAGFVASTYMRGIEYIQVPTTLLACVDSSVGGKVAINTDYGKNLAGSFYQPKAVYINLNFLKTLDERQYKTGLGEVVKYIFIEKSCMFKDELNLANYVVENIEKILMRNIPTLEQLVINCIKLKIAVVEQDEKEQGLRKILNFGHTYAHAIEKITNYKKYTHGEAVVKGILYAFELAEKRGLIDKNYRCYAEDILEKFQFKKIQNYPINKLLNIMKIDKKSDSDSITFILPTEYSTVAEYKLNKEEIL